MGLPGRHGGRDGEDGERYANGSSHFHPHASPCRFATSRTRGGPAVGAVWDRRKNSCGGRRPGSLGGCPGRTRGEVQTNSNQLLLGLSTNSRMKRAGRRKSV